MCDLRKEKKIFCLFVLDGGGGGGGGGWDFLWLKLIFFNVIY